VTPPTGVLAFGAVQFAANVTTSRCPTCSTTVRPFANTSRGTAGGDEAEVVGAPALAGGVVVTVTGGDAGATRAAERSFEVEEHAARSSATMAAAGRRPTPWPILEPRPAAAARFGSTQSTTRRRSGGAASFHICSAELATGDVNRSTIAAEIRR
jgi:hypothetical protein